jgi:hypothetical protein
MRCYICVISRISSAPLRCSLPNFNAVEWSFVPIPYGPYRSTRLIGHPLLLQIVDQCILLHRTEIHASGVVFMAAVRLALELAPLLRSYASNSVHANVVFSPNKQLSIKSVLLGVDLITQIR